MSNWQAPPWSREEDRTLLDAMRAAGGRSRAAVAKAVAERLPGRTAMACNRRIRNLTEIIQDDVAPQVVSRCCLRCRSSFKAPKVIFVCDDCKATPEWRLGIHA